MHPDPGPRDPLAATSLVGGTATSDLELKETDVIWHVVRFDLAEVEEAIRAELEESLAALAAIEEVAWLRVARDVEEPTVTGLLTVFADVEALTRYRVHPDHVPVVERVKALGIPTVRLDIATDDEPADLP